MNIWNNVYWFFYFLIRPNWWIQIYPTNYLWDQELNYLLELYKFEKVDSYFAKLGNRLIWIENHPYASFKEGLSKSLPSRKTRKKAYDKLVNDLMEEIKVILRDDKC